MMAASGACRCGVSPCSTKSLMDCLQSFCATIINILTVFGFPLSATQISNLGPNALTSALANVRPDRPGNRTSECPLMATHERLLRAADVDRYVFLE